MQSFPYNVPLHRPLAFFASDGWYSVIAHYLGAYCYYARDFEPAAIIL